jgi:lipopolysaccharide biosynthesis protein
MASNPKLIAFYLPQFHPTPHNDEWWGKGFTEWINVVSAKKLFPGHEQPHIPADLGFYDLRLADSRNAQAKLAAEYGIYGFCYYYYRFAKEKEELDYPLKEVLKSGEPNFPFMICWANESWHKKFWKFDKTLEVGYESKVLIEQTYDEQDYEDFFYEVLPLFRDKRYIKIRNNPAFIILRPHQFPNVRNFIYKWQELSRREGLEGIHFIGYSNGGSFDNSNLIKIMGRQYMLKTNISYDINTLGDMGFSTINLNRQAHVWWHKSILIKFFFYLVRHIFHLPKIVSYKRAIKEMIGEEDGLENVYPTIMPNWDHTPRSGHFGGVFVNSTPDLFKEHLLKVLRIICNKPEEDQIAFIKAWNEWGEGNYLEPDIKWGRKYLMAVKEALDIIKS